MTAWQWKVVGVVTSAFTAFTVSFLTAYLALLVSGHETAVGIKIALVGAALVAVKDLHSFTSTAPKDVAGS